MGKASEIWKEIKPKIGEMLREINEMESRCEKAQKEAYQKGYETAKRECEDCPKQAYTDTLRMDVYRKGLSDAWEAARKIQDTGGNLSWWIHNTTASEAIEGIRAYEQAQKESEELKKEQSVTTEEVMRQYLDIFCKGKWCSVCPLDTPDFTCGRGYYFLGNSRISDEEVRRAYAEVLQKMREN